MSSSTRSPLARVSLWPLLLTALVTLAVLSPLYVHHARRLGFDASMEVFLAADERTQGSFEKLESMMSDSVACMVLLRMDRVFSDEGAQVIHDASEALLALEGIPRVLSLTRAQRPVRRPGLTLDISSMIEFEPFVPLEPMADEEWAELGELVTDYPWARDLLVSRDGRWTMLVGEVDRELETHDQRARLRTEIELALEPFRSRVEELHVGSFPFIDVEIREALEGDVLRFAIVLPLLLAAILLLTYRSLGVLLCVLTFELLGLGFLPVLFGWYGVPVTLFSGLLFPLIAGLQLTFLTHLMSALRRAIGRGASFPAALGVALQRVQKASVVAGMTTVIGLLSLVVCDVSLVRQFGVLGSQAVLAALLLTFLPALVLARLVGAKEAAQLLEESQGTSTAGPAWGRRLEPLVSVLQARAIPIAVLMGLLTLVAVPAMGRVRTDLRAIEFLSPGSPSRQALEAIDRKMGGVNLFELEVDCGAPGAIQEPENLAFQERLEHFAAGLEGVTNVYGYAQIYAMLNQIWQRDAEGSRHVPTSPTLIAAMGLLVHGQEFLFDESIYDSTRQRTTLFVRTQDMPAARYLELVESIREFGEEHAPEGVLVQPRAGLHSVLESDRRIVTSQVSSLGLCILAVFLTLSVLWRSPRMALVALGVNLLPLTAVLALHGFGGVPLNSITVMVGAVVLGIAVDDSIHLLSYWTAIRSKVPDARLAMRMTLERKLVPMVCTTAVLVSGLALLLFSSFPPVADFGELSVVALLVALCSTLLGAPAALWVVFHRLSRSRAVE